MPWLLLICYPADAQDTLFTYFSKQIRPDTTNLITVAVESTESGYLVAGTYGLSHPITFVMSLDKVGNFRSLLNIDSDQYMKYLTLGQQMVEGYEEGTYWTSYSKDQPNGSGDGDIVLAKVDEFAQLLLYKERQDPLNEDVRAICPGHNGGLLVTGWRQWQSEPQHIYVLKVDEQGNEEWVFEYDDPRRSQFLRWNLPDL